MRPVIKTILLTAVVGCGLLPSAGAYSLGGPIANGPDSWQIQALGYDEPGDENAPKNLGQEFRRNTPVMFYTYDQNFGDYFGSDGIAAVDSAFTVLNLTFTNSPTGPVRGLDGYSANLDEFPLETRDVNFTAQALGILDMKSLMLTLMVEQLGLADPVRYAWTLHDRYLPTGGSCPADMEYLVVQRNFDYISSPLNALQYSAYVNNVLYGYTVTEACKDTAWLAQAVPAAEDPLADAYSAVATSGDMQTYYWGGFLSGLTRDDVAGLRYMLQTNNVNYEYASSNSLLYTVTTNLLAPEVYPPYVTQGTNYSNGTNTGYYIYNGTTNGGYGYGDLMAFLAFAKTNPPATLLAAYPGVVINSVTNSWTIVSNATYISYYTNPVGSVYGATPILVVKTNYNRVYEFLYYYTFANVFTNHWTSTYERLFTVTVAVPQGSVYGATPVTNATLQKIATYSGDFFVLPQFYTNYCPIDIVSTDTIATVLATTNFLTVATTNTASTNSASTNLTSYTYLVTYFTNYSYVIYPVTCTVTSGASGYYQGIEKIQFVKVAVTNYDTYFGQFKTPVTNNYTLNMVTAGKVVPQHLQRILYYPDILISAEDLTSGGAVIPVAGADARDLNFDKAHVLPGLAGPGTIISPTLISWSDSGPVYYNTPSGIMTGTPNFTTTPEVNTNNSFYSGYFILGSFDGTTNDPVVFPNGESINNLENQVLVQVSPTSVANGAVGAVYPAVQFTASGGSIGTLSSSSWSASGLPDGLSLSGSGRLSGTPTDSGTYTFIVTVTGSTDSVRWYYTITIQ